MMFIDDAFSRYKTFDNFTRENFSDAFSNFRKFFLRGSPVGMAFLLQK
jgi:hypothetical protein